MIVLNVYFKLIELVLKWFSKSLCFFICSGIMRFGFNVILGFIGGGKFS